MLILGCLLAFVIAFAPRLILILAWIFGTRWDIVFSNWLWPLLGIIFAPYTTVMYLLVWSPATGIAGFDWLWLALGVLLDVMKWGQIYNNRQGIPGVSETPAAETPAAVE